MTSRPRLLGTRRQRLALLATAAFAGALVPLAGSPAAAQSTETVTFTASCGLLGLGGSSAVDRSELTVVEGSQIEFVNQASRSMTLSWDGGQESVAAGHSYTLPVEEDPASFTVTLRVRCLVDSPRSRVTVTVTPPPTPDPVPTTPAPVDDPGETPPSQEPAPSPSAVGGAYGEAAEPDGSARPGGWVPGDATEVDEPEPLPGTSPADGAMSNRPEPADADESEADAEVGPTEDADDTADIAPAASSAPDDGSVGLLALIATVCVVGVSAGAIRVLLGQRAVRDPA